MPVVFQLGHIKFYIYSRDHNPPHVHIKSANAELVVNIINFEITAAKGFSMKEVKNLLKVVKVNQDLLLDEWETYHG